MQKVLLSSNLFISFYFPHFLSQEISNIQTEPKSFKREKNRNIWLKDVIIEFNPLFNEMRMGHHGQKKRKQKILSIKWQQILLCFDGTLAHLVLYDISSKKWKGLAARCHMESFWNIWAINEKHNPSVWCSISTFEGKKLQAPCYLMEAVCELALVVFIYLFIGRCCSQSVLF